MSKIDADKIPALLESVKGRPALYNFDSHRRCNESKLRSQLWEEVGQELNEPADQCKETWSFLRSRLRIIMVKKEEGGTSNWPWFDAMQFFVPHMTSFPSTKPKRLLGKIKKPTTPNSMAGKRKHWRHSLSEGLKKYKNNFGAQANEPPSAPERRRSMPAYAAKSTTQVAGWMKGSNTSTPNNTDRHTFTSPHMSYSSQANEQEEGNDITLDRESIRSPSFHQSLPLANGSSASVQEEVNSISSLSERKSLESYKEYHFVCCMMEMLEQVPVNKRNMVKAKVMAEIASAYQ